MLRISWGGVGALANRYASLCRASAKALAWLMLRISDSLVEPVHLPDFCEQAGDVERVADPQRAERVRRGGFAEQDFEDGADAPGHGDQVVAALQQEDDLTAAQLIPQQSRQRGKLCVAVVPDRPFRDRLGAAGGRTIAGDGGMWYPFPTGGQPQMERDGFCLATHDRWPSSAGCRRRRHRSGRPSRLVRRGRAGASSAYR